MHVPELISYRKQFEARHRFSAPRRFPPLHGQPITGVPPSFLHLQSQFIRLVERSEGLHLARVKVETPISRFVRMSLGMMFAQIGAHERRHVEQARKVRDLEGNLAPEPRIAGAVDLAHAALAEQGGSD
jgi:hypothetical protein